MGMTNERSIEIRRTAKAAHKHTHTHTHNLYVYIDRDIERSRGQAREYAKKTLGNGMEKDT